jgi:Glycosyltransferase 61
MRRRFCWLLSLLVAVLIVAALLHKQRSDRIVVFTHGPLAHDRLSQVHCSASKGHTDALHYRSCLFHNVCIDGELDLLYYFYDESDERSSLLSTKQLIEFQCAVNLGTYVSSPTLRIEAQNLAGNGAKFERIEQWRTRNAALLDVGATSMYYHWILDDVLGAFWLTQHYFNSAGDDVDLALGNDNVFRDERRESLLRRAFTDDRPLLRVSQSEEPRCFRRLAVGPGAHHFGGPGFEQIDASLLRQFAARLAAPPPSSGGAAPFALVVQRSNDRLLLNAGELVDALGALRVDARLVHLETLPFDEQVALVRRARFLVSVHGSALVNMLWLPADATVVELFPYEFTRPSYEHLSALLGLRYVAWRNDRVEDTRFHPEILSRHRVPEAGRARIVADPRSRFNSAHSWPANLYWVNQDTRVDVNAVVHRILHG